MKKIILINLLLLSAVVNSLFAGKTEQFSRGNELYQKGEYSLALESYKQILNSDSHSSSLYFNMGNCYYKLQDIDLAGGESFHGPVTAVITSVDKVI